MDDLATAVVERHFQIQQERMTERIGKQPHADHADPAPQMSSAFSDFDKYAGSVAQFDDTALGQGMYRPLK